MYAIGFEGLENDKVSKGQHQVSKEIRIRQHIHQDHCLNNTWTANKTNKQKKKPEMIKVYVCKAQTHSL